MGLVPADGAYERHKRRPVGTIYGVEADLRLSDEAGDHQTALVSWSSRRRQAAPSNARRPRTSTIDRGSTAA
jgi:hypothetical protein